MKQISVLEYGRIQTTDLSPVELKRLRAFDEARGPASPAVFDWRFRKYVRARNIVGVIQVPGLQVEILPKISDRPGLGEPLDKPALYRNTAQSNLLFMLGYTHKLRMLDVDIASLHIEKMHLLDTLVAIFAARLGQELKQGLNHSYVHQEDCLPVLKGKLLFSQQIRQSATNAARFHVRYDEYIPDTWINRILKAASFLLSRAVGTSWLRKSLMDLLERLSPVTDIHVVPEHFKKIKWNRNNERFHPCVDFARVVFAGQSPSPARGGTQMFSLLFPMDTLFEEFVGQFLVRHATEIGLKRNRIRLQALGQRRWLLREQGQKGRFQLKPDILFLGEHGDVKKILDTKWKRLSPDRTKQGVSQSDIYQLYTYAKRYNCPHSILLYPKRQGLRDCAWTLDEDPSKSISVRLLDLNFDLVTQRGRLLGELKKLLGAHPIGLYREADG